MSSISSSRRRERYSSRGAPPISEASSARSSTDNDRHLNARTYSHNHERMPLVANGRQDSPASSMAIGSAGRSTRHGLFATKADDLPDIPVKAAASTREHANALVGSAPKPTKSRDRLPKSGRHESSFSRVRSHEPAAASSSQIGRDSMGSSTSRTRRTERPLPAAPTAGTHIHPPTQVPAPDASIPEPLPQPTAQDLAFLLTNEDLMYGEDMELDLPPSYFEAVHGAEEEDD